MAAPAAGQRPLTVEAIYGHGALTGNLPAQLAWSPDGKHLTYVDGGKLIELGPGGGSHVLVGRGKMSVLDESNDSERVRAHRERYHLSTYFWAPDSSHLLFDSDGRLWYYDLHNGTGVQIGFSGGLVGDDPKFSPNGRYITFIRHRSLVEIPLGDSSSAMMILAPAPNPATVHGQVVLNGEVDWVYREELDTNSNYFWSPDSRHVAYLEMNETDVPRYPLVDWLSVHPTIDLQRYPQPGDLNPYVRVGVVGAKGGRTVFVRLPMPGGQGYIPRFGWVDRRTLWIETLSRDHKHRALYFAAPGDGDVRQMLEISDDKFLDENYDVFVGSGYIVLSDWTSGHNQIYLYTYDESRPLSADGKLVRQLTSGDFEVGDVYRVDFKKKLVDYASNQGNPLEQQLWEVDFEGARTQLSAGAGFHEGKFAPVGSAFVDQQSDRLHAPTLSLCRAAGNCSLLWRSRALDAYHLRAPEQMEVKARDGTTLYATLLMPAGAKARASVPLILNPYGGPGEQTVANRWSYGLLFDELLSQHGFAVLHADNRGMAGRGRAFAQAAYHDFGRVQFQDQMTVLDFVLARYPQLDPKRLGWWGWSWGGTFTLYAMTHSNRFRAGVAVAPVSNWLDYDSIYTERYLGSPADDPEAYRVDSVVNFASGLKGHLLLVIATGDDNVHMDNSVQFIERLVNAGIPYDLQIFPGKTHSILGPAARVELYRRILAHFERYLMPPQ
jgi:dipeptidyl-peptidase 4